MTSGRRLGWAVLALLVLVGAGIFVVTRPHGNADQALAAVVRPASTPAATVSATPAPVEATAVPKPRPKTKPKPHVTPTPPRSVTATPRAATHAASSTGRIRFGHTYTGQATFYAADGGGNCSFPPTGDLMVGAMNQTDYDNSAACGDYLSVSGPNGTSITIKVVDRCPECPPGNIDLSAQAFAKLAPASAGEIPIRWHLVSPQLSGPVDYVYKSGSSQYWCAIQVRNHRTPIRSLAVLAGGRWTTLPRQTYDYFVSPNGAGCGGRIRVTDIEGRQLTDSGITVSPGTVQPGHAQFPAP